MPSLSLSSSQNSRSLIVSAVGFGFTVIVFSAIHSTPLTVTFTKYVVVCVGLTSSEDVLISGSMTSSPFSS